MFLDQVGVPTRSEFNALLRRGTRLLALLLLLAPARVLLAQGMDSTTQSQPAALRIAGPQPVSALLQPDAGPGNPRADTLPCPDCHPPIRFWAAFGELMLVQALPSFYNQYVQDAVWADISIQTIKNNFAYPWQWDDNAFVNNQFSHPYHGNLYFNAARTNGYNFWQSFAWPFVGSFMWETMGEAWAPAPNDFVNTSLGGVVLGETLYRLSSLTLDNTATGSERTWREIGAALIDPLRGFNRLIRGETSRVSANPPDWRPSQVLGALDLGYRQTSTAFSFDSISNGVSQWDAMMSLAYGNPVKDLGGKPFSYFALRAELAGPPQEGAHLLSQLSARGSLASWSLSDNHRHQIALSMAYDYFSNPAVTYGGQSIQAGLVSVFGTPASRWFAQTNVLLNAVVLGATQSDYYQTIEGRNYDYGPGLGTLVNARVLYNHKWQANLSYLGLWIHTIDGSNSSHYQDALTFEARYWATKRLGAGVSFTGYSRHSNYDGQPDVAETADFFRLFLSTAFPEVPQ